MDDGAGDYEGYREAVRESAEEEREWERRYAKVKDKISPDTRERLTQKIGDLYSGCRINATWVRAAEQEVANGY